MNVIILAAGYGTRFSSKKSKILQKICGKKMIDWVLDCHQKAKKIVVVVSEQIKNLFPQSVNLEFVVQDEKLGTGKAVSCALDKIDQNNPITAISCGDTPLLDSIDSENMYKFFLSENLDLLVGAFLTKDVGYGKLVFGENGFKDIVETKQNNIIINEEYFANAGFYFVKSAVLSNLVSKIQLNSQYKEYLLTDIVKIAKSQNLKCSYYTLDKKSTIGVNSIADWNEVNKIMNNKIVAKLSERVFFLSPESVSVSFDLSLGVETTIEPSVVFGLGVTVGCDCLIGRGSKLENCSIGNNVYIGGNCYIGSGVVIDDNVTILDGCWLENTHIKSGSKIGPMARLRNEVVVESNALVGNFVEIKKSHIGEKTKIAHLSYVGDATFGSGVNVGAGVVFCNYDGKKKNHSNVGQGAFIGSNSSIISPVNIGSESMITAATVVCKNIESGDIVTRDGASKTIKGGAVRYFAMKDKKNN